jgi:hypothetical protein
MRDGVGRFDGLRRYNGRGVLQATLAQGSLGGGVVVGVGRSVFVLDEAGTVFVIKTGPKFELLGTNKIDETFWATPAAANGRVVSRGTGALYCVKK